MVEKIRLFFHDLGHFTLFSLDSFRYIPANIKKPQEIFRHVFSIGVKSVPVVAVTGLFIGMIMGLQLGDAIDKVIAGTAVYASGGISVSFIKEIGPVFTSLIVVSRVCSSVTAQLGTMKVTEQIDALKTFAVNPVSYLVTPRVLAGMLSLPILGFISITISLIGSWFMITTVLDIPTSAFIEIAQYPLKARYVYESIIKMVVIGGFMLLVSTYCGFEAKDGAAGVGEATIRSVVVSSFLVILLDYILGAAFMIFSGGAL